MAFEIERKFLIASDASTASVRRETLIRQAYLANQDKASIRVRICDNTSATLSVKSRGACLKRLELEYEIPVIDAEALLELRHGAVVEKRRSLVPYGNHHVWEVDTFVGDNAELVIGEIELNAEDEAFERPSWIGAEITGQVQYYNSALSLRPFCEWDPANHGAAR